jgi:Ku protein
VPCRPHGDALTLELPQKLDPEELEEVAIESKRTIEIEEFVPKSEIDEIYMRDPYFIVPDGEVGQQAFAVIREAIRKDGMVALGKVVFTSREHIIALDARDKGMMGIPLRYPYEVRDQNEYFEDIENEKVPKDMLDLAIHIVETKKGKFEPRKFEDQYEDALKDLIRKKQKVEKIKRPKEPSRSNVINLMGCARVLASSTLWFSGNRRLEGMSTTRGEQHSRLTLPCGAGSLSGWCAWRREVRGAPACGDCCRVRRSPMRHWKLQPALTVGEQ